MLPRVHPPPPFKDRDQGHTIRKLAGKLAKRSHLQRFMELTKKLLVKHISIQWKCCKQEQCFYEVTELWIEIDWHPSVWLTWKSSEFVDVEGTWTTRCGRKANLPKWKEHSTRIMQERHDGPPSRWLTIWPPPKRDYTLTSTTLMDKERKLQGRPMAWYYTAHNPWPTDAR